MKLLLPLTFVFSLFLTQDKTFVISEIENPKRPHQLIPTMFMQYDGIPKYWSDLEDDFKGIKDHLGEAYTGTGTSNYSGLAEGGITYYISNINIEDTPELENAESIDFKARLKAIIQSLIIEYKIYNGAQNLSAYSVFGLGNFKEKQFIDSNDQYLEYANQYLFSRPTALKITYQWAFPYIKDAFLSVTIEEQKTLLKKIQIAKDYLKTIDESKTLDTITNYINQNNLVDRKVVKFIYRRLYRKQWDVEEANYWLNKLESDFSPLIAEGLQYHYNYIQKVDDNLHIVVNHRGKYGLVNDRYEIILDTIYHLIKPNKYVKDVLAYKSFFYPDFQIIDYSKYEETGKVVVPIKENWKSMEKIGEVYLKFSTYGQNSYDGIYDLKSESIVIDRKQIVEFHPNIEDTTKGVFVISEDNNSLGVYNLKLERISENLGKVTDYGSYVSVSLKRISGKNQLSFRNQSDKYGVIDFNGKVVVPFKYDHISYNEDTKEYKVLFEDEFYILKRNGKLKKK